MPRAKTYRTQALVLKKTKLGEQDMILTCLCEDGSQRQVVSKGARKPGGRMAGRCELFCSDDLLIACGRSLDVIAEAHLLNPHKQLRGDYVRVAAASAICEVAELTSFEDAQDPFLFPLLERTLTACEQATTQAQQDSVVAAYTLKVLAHGGWHPELDTCVLCADPAPSRFSASAGGVLCESCARDIAGAEPITSEERHTLQALIGTTFDSILESNITPDNAAYAVSLAHIWAATMLDARLKAFEFYLGV